MSEGIQITPKKGVVLLTWRIFVCTTVELEKISPPHAAGINKSDDGPRAVCFTFIGRRYRCDTLRHKLHRFDLSPYLLQSLACWCVSTLWTPVTNKISRFQKSKMAVAAILKIPKKCNISAMEQPILTKFSTVMRLGPADTNSKEKFTISKITIWRRPPSWKIKKS